VGRYTPKQGDFIYENFDQQSGHEQKGRRLALIISKTGFNKRTGMAFIGPVTSRNKGFFPFHVRYVSAQTCQSERRLDSLTAFNMSFVVAFVCMPGTSKGDFGVI
jgi:hypothetical protein